MKRKGPHGVKSSGADGGSGEGISAERGGADGVGGVDGVGVEGAGGDSVGAVGSGAKGVRPRRVRLGVGMTGGGSGLVMVKYSTLSL